MGQQQQQRQARSLTTLRKFRSDIYFAPCWCIRVPRNVYGRRSVPKEKPRTDSRPYLNAYGQQSVQQRLRTKFSLFDLVFFFFFLQIEAREPASSFFNLPAPLESTT